MKKNNGFTLVELLAVIAILAILVIIALPNVMGMFNQAKESSFMTETKQIYKVAEQKWMNDSMFQTGERVYTRCKTCSGPSLDLSGRTELEYYIKFDQAGKVVEYYVTDGSYQFEYSGNGLLPTDIKNVDRVANLNDSEKIAIENDVPTGAVSGGGGGSNIPLANGTLVNNGDNESNVFNNTSLRRGDFEKITFQSTLTEPTGMIGSWDASAERNNAIKAYYTDTNSNGKYELILAADGKIKAPQDMSYIFAMFSEVESFEGLSNFDTSNTTNMTRVFGNCFSVTNLDLRSFNTSNVTTMSSFFGQCNGLISVNLSGWNTSNVTDMSGMFFECTSLQSLNLSNFNTSKVEHMDGMFFYCYELTSLNVSGWNTPNLKSMSQMFYLANKLTSLDLSRFNTSQVTDMSEVFWGCTGLQTLNISGWDTSKVTKMIHMFSGNRSLTTLDLSSFDTSRVTESWYMFTGCENLRTIKVSNKFVTTNITRSEGMFDGCTSLVGGAGTTFNSSKIDKTYARVDGGPSNPGYFTLN